MKAHTGMISALMAAVLVLGTSPRLAAGEPEPPKQKEVEGKEEKEPEIPKVYPLAIFPFHERGSGVKGYGAKVSDILFACLAANPDLYLVERAELQRLLEELEVNLSGMVTPATANRVGQMTGAKIIVTGSVIEVGTTLYLVAKIIGTETSRVFGASAKGRTGDRLDPLVEQLAGAVGNTVTRRGSSLVAGEVRTEDRIAALRKRLGNAERPTVVIRVEERHVGRATYDPAAQTEIALFCKETGFEVIDEATGNLKLADYVITGAGFSEFAMRRGNLVSVKARLEVKAVDRKTDKVVAVDRQSAVVVDLTEQNAGKAALQQAAAAVAERLLPKLVAGGKAQVTGRTLRR